MKKIPSDTHVADLVGQDVAMATGAIVPGGGFKAEIQIPRGTVMRAVGMGSALHLETRACPACGVGLRIRNVPRRYLALPEDGDEQWPAKAGWVPGPYGTCKCSRCGFASSKGDSPEKNALDAGGKTRWKFCPGCGAGMNNLI